MSSTNKAFIVGVTVGIILHYAYVNAQHVA
jgi:hypothetical protein